MLQDIGSLVNAEFLFPGLPALVGTAVASLGITRDIRKMMVVSPMMLYSLWFLGFNVPAVFAVIAAILYGYSALNNTALANIIAQVNRDVLKVGALNKWREAYLGAKRDDTKQWKDVYLSAKKEAEDYWKQVYLNARTEALERMREGRMSVKANEGVAKLKIQDDGSKDLGVRIIGLRKKE